jgi:FkbM family methyltransferase
MGVFARTIRRVLPERWQPPARYLYERTRGLLERELPLAIGTVMPGDCVIDVGANVGIYTYAFARAGACVEAFEPQSACASVLRAFAATTRSVRVHKVALGAKAGRATLHVPISDEVSRAGNASLRSVGLPAQAETVEVATLDSFNFPAAFIKIDVEGAEMDVIAGAGETIRTHRPLMLIEIEQRHHEDPMSRVFDQLAALGYDGFFLGAESRMRPISEFDLDRDQRRPLRIPGAGPYINNFLFQHRDPEGASRWTRSRAIK